VSNQFLPLHPNIPIDYSHIMPWLVVVFLLFIFGELHAKPLELSINAEAAILINAKTGKILFEKNAHQMAFPASTTKIATALVALQKSRQGLDITFTAERESVASITPEAKRQSNYRSPPYWLETDGTHVGIKRGEEIRLYDLLHMLLIASANDAANVIAQGLGSTIPKFMEETNAYLKKIGCDNTHFNNPHGLHHPEHVTTAYDLAIMAREGLRDSLFCQIVASVRYTAPQTNLALERHLVQTNQLLKKGSFYYPHATGIKTGFTQTAGKNLVASAQTEDRTLIAVALGYKGSRSELYQDVIKLFESAFNEPKMRQTFLPKGEQKIKTQVAGARNLLKTYLAKSLTYDYYPSEEVAVKVSMHWQIPPLPIAKGTQVGNIKLVDTQGIALCQIPLLALEDLKPTLISQVKTALFKKPLGRKITFGSMAAFILLLLWRLKKSRRRS
jgi:serine-type D-Ala-D-Ala carboxypeptidase (penicillin-binding protein 5/6)